MLMLLAILLNHKVYETFFFLNCTGKLAPYTNRYFCPHHLLNVYNLLFIYDV